MLEEGIQLWKQYDSSRKMTAAGKYTCILTAHGLTKHVSPECRCWGQGAEEAPYEWLAFMCCMSVVIDEEARVHGYVTGGEAQTTKLHKIIYADDGTYFARSKRMYAVHSHCTGTIMCDNMNSD